jgi:serine/threonine protein kinase
MYEYFAYYIFLDRLERVIGTNTTACVYESLLEEKNEKLAVKIFSTNSDSSNEIIFEQKIKSDYSLDYLDQFKIGKCVCICMPLMDNSLEKFIQSLMFENPKRLLSDDVFCCFFF